MKILHIGKYYPPVRGGMETVLHEICTGLAGRGHDVSVLVAGSDSLTRCEPLTSGVSAGSDGTGRLTRLSCLGRMNSQPLIPDLAGALRRELACFRPDVVHLHLPNPGACVAWLAQGLLGDGPGADCALAIWHHADITRQKWAGWLVKPLVGLCYDRAAGVCVSSNALRAHSPLLVGCRADVVVIPFGIDLEPWLHLCPEGDGDFLFVGRLVHYKGVDILLEAMKRVPEARLTIVGSGPEEEFLYGKAHEPGLDGRVSFAGEVGEADLRRLMGTARALVLPSSLAGETFGLVQLEAMAASLPVISTALPTGVAEVGLDEITGRCVPPGDVKALAKALAELLSSARQGRAWGEAGRQRVQQLFSRDRMLDALEDWYRKLKAG